MSDEQVTTPEDEQTDEASDQGKEVPPLPPIMQGIIERVKSLRPELNPVGRSDGWVEVVVPPDQWRDVAVVLREDKELNLDYLSMISAVDYKDKGFQVVYHFLSLMANKKLVVKVDLIDREKPTIASIIDLWPTAAFHEREAWDLMGIWFDGHPNLRRILLREDWVGHPLRKDYVDDRPPRERVTKETYYEALREERD